MSGLIVYASKYGSTAEYASLIAEKLGTKALRASEASPEAVSGADFLILGSPIYAYSVLPEMEEFLAQYREALGEKPLAAFVVCGDTMWNPKAEEGGNKNLVKLTRLLPVDPFSSAIFGGRMRMEELDDEDGPKIRAFYEKIGRSPDGFDRMEPDHVDPFVDRINKYLVSGYRM